MFLICCSWLNGFLDSFYVLHFFTNFQNLSATEVIIIWHITYILLMLYWSLSIFWGFEYKMLVLPSSDGWLLYWDFYITFLFTFLMVAFGIDAKMSCISNTTLLMDSGQQNISIMNWPLPKTTENHNITYYISQTCASFFYLLWIVL